MWGFTTVAGAFGLALIAMSVAFSGGGVILAVPVAFVLIVVGVLVDLRRRRTSAATMEEFRQESETDKVDFTERDRETLCGR
jgi:hypothetical protein